MLICPKCSTERNIEDIECIFCGVIFAKIPELIKPDTLQVIENEIKEEDTEPITPIKNETVEEEHESVFNDESNTQNQQISKIFFRPFIVIPFSLITIIFLIYLYNYFMLQYDFNKVIKSDPRNEGISMAVNYSYYLDTDILIISLKKIEGQNSKLDVFRVVLQCSEAFKNKNFDEIIFSYRWKRKYKINGNYFNQLGNEYSFQNINYTLRTFPENVYHLDGSRAFSVWSGGIIGVLREQMEDFNEFHETWYWNEITDF